VAWGRKAISLAEQFDDKATLAAAHNSVGAALLFIDPAAGREEILASMRIARHLEDGGVGVADAYTMIGTGSGELFDFDIAKQYLNEGVAFANQHDLDRLGGYMEAWLALVDVFEGRWDAAGERAHALLARGATGSTNRVTALIALSRLRVRRGDPGVNELLDEALDLGTRSGTLQRLAPVCGLRAEQAWLAGDADRMRTEAMTAFELAAQKQHPWFLGEMAYWRWQAGDVAADLPVGDIARPWALSITGRWREAADDWAARGCVYEAARALMAGDQVAQLEALAVFERLGARPAIERLRQRMREDRVRGVPRGPRQATRENAAGLTAREMQILVLVAEGCANSEIARRLSRSPRTVDHHLAAILDKLAVGTRTEAVAAARRVGLLGEI
jgi:DNA-binding CsgD family transcriptional regulator